MKCGKEIGEFVKGLCVPCFLEKGTLIELPKSITVDYDRRSGRLRSGRDWVPDSDGEVAKIVAGRILSLAAPQKLPIEGLAITVRRVQDRIAVAVSFSTIVEGGDGGVAGGVSIPFSAELSVYLRKTISDASMKLSSNYHEAIMQVRFAKRPTLEEGRQKLAEVLALLKAEKRKIELSEAIDTKNVPGGFDLLIGSAKAAKKVATRMGRKYGIRPIYSNKMIGMNDNGTTKYRHTYCLKF
ncbi:MAG: hypothetical protein HY544_02645 [Candidatus Diapherotrites archaeon]|uniref:Nmd3 N-terminal domain-containing protein n=1 Tax=Candidatus Iainarchaeum sp. TaxID=3101447 RepID=A0A8T3YL11_9ARCH|nr:hypothetical protein [Candidatus Diapherotrites archaeon]